MANTYVGFSTVNKNRPSFKLYDLDIVKQDILNHFYTKRGERVMMPEFGSIIPDLLMDPFDDVTQAAILEDARNIISSDPRVELVNINPVTDNYTLRLEILLKYVPQDNVETLYVEFERENREAF